FRSLISSDLVAQKRYLPCMGAGFRERAERRRATWTGGKVSFAESEAPDDFDVRYLVIGGYAVGFHGRPRTTKIRISWILVGSRQVAEKCRAQLRSRVKQRVFHGRGRPRFHQRWFGVEGLIADGEEIEFDEFSVSVLRLERLSELKR